MTHKHLRYAAAWLTSAATVALLALALRPGLLHRGEAPQREVPVPSGGREGAIAANAPAPPQLDPPAIEAVVLRDEVFVPGLDDGAPGPAAGPGPGSAATRFDCVIEPSDVVEIGSPVIGVIESMPVERSAFVKTGDVVARLESREERAAVELARARAEMDIEVGVRVARLELGERRKQRAEKMFEGNALSLDVREQAEMEARLASLELEQARENRKLAALQLEQARAALERRTIRSPIAGVVTQRLMSPGEVVDQQTILRIARIDPLHVQVILPASMIGEIRPGLRALVEPELSGDAVHVAEVELVDRVIDAASGTFGARLALPNPDHAIPGGLNCQVEFAGE